MADDLLQVLTRFHREVVMPDVERAVGEQVGRLRDEMLPHFDAIDQRFDDLEKRFDSTRNDMLSHFDSVYVRFDQLKTEYYAIVEGLRRLENRMDALEKRMAALESPERDDLEQLKAQVLALHDRLAIVEAQLQQQRAANAQLAGRNPES